MGIGKSSWKKAKEKAKEKSNQTFSKHLSTRLQYEGKIYHPPIGKRPNGDPYDQVYIKDGVHGMVDPVENTFHTLRYGYDGPANGYNPKDATLWVNRAKNFDPNFKVKPVDLLKAEQASASQHAGVNRATVLSKLPVNTKRKKKEYRVQESRSN